MSCQIPDSQKDCGRKLIYACESCQVQAQKLVAQCSGGAGTSCADDVGTFFAAAKHCIDACEAMIAENVEHLLVCGDRDCIKLQKKCVEQLKACVRVCERALEQCAIDAKACVDAVVAVVQGCDHAAQATQTCVSYGEGTC